MNICLPGECICDAREYSGDTDCMGRTHEDDVRLGYVDAPTETAALDGDGTPGPTNATDAPMVAKRTADGASSNSRSTDGGNDR